MYSVLIVDDEEIIRNGIAQVIDWNKAGYKLVGTAEDGIDALHKITTYLPDIVITDLKMPVMDGISLIKEVHKLEISTEFIILSGYSEFEYAKTAMEYGIRYYLLKPTSDNTILQTLNQVREEIQKKQATKQFIEESKIKLRKLEPLVKEQFYRDIIMGVPYTHNEYEHLKQFLHINTKEITLALYKIEGVFSDEDLFILMKICKKHGLEHELQGIIINSHLITTYQLLSEQILLHFIDQIRAEFYSYCNKKVTIIYSISVPLVTIHKTYHDILEALQYINAHTTGQVIELNQIYGILKEKKQEKKLLKTLFHSIACGDKQQVNQNIENLFKTIHHQKTTCTIYRNYLVETLRWIWEEGNFGEKHEISLQSYIEQFSRLTSINDLEKLFYQIVIELTLHIYNSTKLYNNKLVNLLRLYTITYISNEKLTLKWLAKNYLHVDADYLSKLFIKETGQRYKQYLLHLRIEKAKQLLDLYDEDTIYEIATKVGMGNNPQYFSHIFKKHTGLSPSDYKQRHKNRIFNQR